MLATKNSLKSGEIFLSYAFTAPARGRSGRAQTMCFDICLTDGTIVGDCELRLGEDESTSYGGHIGYEVYPPYRGRGLAAKACALLFELAREKGMREVIITCAPENAASRRTCEALGGRLECCKTLPEGSKLIRTLGRQVLVYRIAL